MRYIEINPMIEQTGNGANYDKLAEHVKWDGHGLVIDLTKKNTPGLEIPINDIHIRAEANNTLIMVQYDVDDDESEEDWSDDSIDYFLSGDYDVILENRLLDLGFSLQAIRNAFENYDETKCERGHYVIDGANDLGDEMYQSLAKVWIKNDSKDAAFKLMLSSIKEANNITPEVMKLATELKNNGCTWPELNSILKSASVGKLT